MYPIFILSKGRPKCKTAEHFPNAKIVIEPQDESLYRVYRPSGDFLILPENNQGIAYSRQYTLDHVRSSNAEWFWMLDDDINAFYAFKDRKGIKIAGEIALAETEDIVIEIPNVGQACLEESRFAYAATELYSNNSHCEACTLINVKRTKDINYCLQLRLKEDIDFSLQILAKGLDNIRIKKYGFTSPTVGTNSGGLKKLYGDEAIQLEESQKIVDIWGDPFCKIGRKRTGRVDVIVKWSALAKAVKVALSRKGG